MNAKDPVAMPARIMVEASANGLVTSTASSTTTVRDRRNSAVYLHHALRAQYNLYIIYTICLFKVYN